MMTATGSVARAHAKICRTGTSHLGMILFTSSCNVLDTVRFVLKIGSLVYPSTTIAEPGTVALYVIGGMVSLTWHGGRDLG
jgi:hypothetical protein